MASLSGAFYRATTNHGGSFSTSINSVRYQTNELGIILDIDSQQKTVGLERSATDLPGIDAYLNRDETPAVLKFRAATSIAVIGSVTDATHFSVSTGQGLGFTKGNRLLIGTDVVESFDGREAFVESASGDDITLVSPGLTGMAVGQLVLVNTTVPAKDAAVLVRYAYERQDEATVSDLDAIAQYGEYPLTLPEQDHIQDFNSAFLQAQSFLERFKNGITQVSVSSNSALITEPDSLQALAVNLTRRPDPVNRTVTISRVVVKPAGENYRYEIQGESADPVKPLDDLAKGRNLVIGSDGAIIFEVGIADQEASDAEDITVREVSTLYIDLANADNRRLGEWRLEPIESQSKVAGTGANVQAGSEISWGGTSALVSNNSTNAFVFYLATAQPDSAELWASNFGFSIPGGATIQGIEVIVEKNADPGTGTGTETVVDEFVQLCKGGVKVGNNNADTVNPWSPTANIDIYGGSDDLWGTTWTPTDINASDFGCFFEAEYNGDGSPKYATLEVDYVQMRVHYTV